MGFSIKQRTVNGKQALAVSGRIINVDSEKFKIKLSEFCSKEVSTAIVDFSTADFIDSFGLGALVGLHTHLEKEGKKLIILNTNSNPAGYIKKLFEMTSLDTIFTIVTSENQL